MCHLHIKLQTKNYWWTTEQEMKTYYYYLIKALYLNCANVFSMKVLIGNTIFTSPTGDGTAILRGHSSHVKV